MSTPVTQCGDHLGGKLGEILFNQFLKLGWIRKLPGDKVYAITPKGEREFGKLGIAPAKLALEEEVVA